MINKIKQWLTKNKKNIIKNTLWVIWIIPWLALEIYSSLEILTLHIDSIWLVGFNVAYWLVILLVSTSIYKYKNIKEWFLTRKENNVIDDKDSQIKNLQQELDQAVKLKNYDKVNSISNEIKELQKETII